MDSIRRRMNAQRTGYRVKKLWLEYKQSCAGSAGAEELVAAGGEGSPHQQPPHQDYQHEQGFNHLAAFIDSVYAGEGAAGLIFEGLSADWGEIMALLLDVAGKRRVPTREEKEEVFSSYAALRTTRVKALSLVEGCIKDEKFREELRRQWPQAPIRVLELLKEVEMDKEQVLALRILERLVQGGAPPVELCRVDGFRVMVQLLSSEDRELVLQVLSTLRHFVDGLLLPEPADGPQSDAAGTPRQSSGSNTKGSGTSLARAISSVGRLAPWLSNLVDGSWSRQQSWRSGMDGDKGGLLSTSLSSEHPRRFVLSKLELEEAEQLLEDLERERVSSSWPRVVSLSSTTSEAVSEPLEEKVGVKGPIPSSSSRVGSGRWEETCSGVGGGASVAAAQSMIRDMVVLHGALDGLVRWMGKAEVLAEGIEVLETLQLLLRRHVPAQSEFSALGGYREITSMLDRLVERYVPGEDVDAFIKEALSLLMSMALDGPVGYGAKVRNCPALLGLFTLVSSSSDLDVSLQAVRCLLDLLALHPLNLVCFEHVGGMQCLLRVLASALLPFYTQQQAAVNLEHVSQFLAVGGDATNEVATPPRPSTKGPPSSDPEVGACRPAWKPEHHFRLCQSVTALLQQMSIVSSDRDARFLNMYALLIRHYIAIRNASTRAASSIEEPPAVPPLPTSPCPPPNPSSVPTTCSHCQLDPAAMRCLNDQCIGGAAPFLCQECYHVLHKAPDRRSHIRVRLLKPVMPSSSPVPSLPPLSSPTVTLPSSSSEPWLSRLITHLLICLRDLLDDRKARNQPLDSFHGVDALIDALQETAEDSIADSKRQAAAKQAACNPDTDASSLDRSSKGKEGKSNEDGGEVLAVSATPSSESSSYMLSLLEVLARTLLVTGAEDCTNLERWSERGGWKLLALLVIEPAIPQEFSEAEDDLIRRFALWVLREALLSWISLHPDDASHLYWFVYILRRVVESYALLPSEKSEGGGEAVMVVGSRRLRGPLCQAVLQELRLLFAHVVDHSHVATIDELAAVLGPELSARPASWRSLSQPTFPFVNEHRTHIISVQGMTGSATESLVLGRCGQSFSLLVKRGMVHHGAVELLVELVHHHMAAMEEVTSHMAAAERGASMDRGEYVGKEPSASAACSAQLLGSVACLTEFIVGCRDAKVRLGALVGYSNIPRLLPESLPASLRFNLLVEASVTDRLVPCISPFTVVHFNESSQSTMGDAPEITSAGSSSDADPLLGYGGAGWGAGEGSRDPSLSSSSSCPWAIMPVYYMPVALAPIFNSIYVPQTHLSAWPACSSLLDLTSHDDVSNTSALQVSPASSISSSRPTSCHYDKDISSRSNLGASSVASTNSLINLNFRVKLEETNNPQGIGVFDDEGIMPPESDEASDTSHDLEVDLFNLHLTRFLDAEAASLPFLALSSLDLDDQPSALRVLSRLLDANPDSCRVLMECSFGRFLLKMACSAPDAVQPLYLQLVAQFCCYSVAASDVCLLFDLASGSSSAWTGFTRAAHDQERSDLPESQSMTRRELQMQLLYVIGRVVEHRAPSSFFHFNGTYGGVRMYARDRMSAAKGGYTIAAWVRPSAFAHESSVALVSIAGQRSSYIEVQLSTKRRRRSPSDSLPAYLRLVLRICDDEVQHEEADLRGGGNGVGVIPASTTFHVITLQDFEWKEGGAWHQMVITHQLGGIQVWIDGRGIGGYEATDDGLLQRLYMCVTKDRDLSVNIGLPASVCRRSPMPEGTEETHSTLFCGQVGAITILDGAWDELQVRTAAGRFQFEEGPACPLALGKRILTADPATLIHSPERDTISSSLAASGMAAATGGKGDYSLFSLLSGSKDEGGAAPSAQLVGSSVQVHSRMSMTEAIREAGALQLCLPFFLMGPEQQVAALRLLGGIARSSADDACAIMEAKTLGVLLHVLTASLSFLCMEVFDVIFDLITSITASAPMAANASAGGITTSALADHPLRMVAHPPGLTLVVDLLCYCGHNMSLQYKVLEGIIELLDDNIHNLGAWHRELGAVACLRLLHLHTPLPSSSTSGAQETMGGGVMLEVPEGSPRGGYTTTRHCLSPLSRLRELAIKLIKVTITSSSSIGHPIVRSSYSTSALASGFTADDLRLLLIFLLARSSSSAFPSSQPSSGPTPSLLLSLILRLLQDPGGAALLSMLRQCMPSNNHWLVVLELLGSPITEVRVQAIQLTCLLLMRGRGTVDAKALTHFEKMGGFAVMCESLGRYPPDVATCDALLSLMLGRWSVMHEPGASKASKETDFWPRNWSFFGTANEDASLGCPTPSPDLPTYYPAATEQQHHTLTRVGEDRGADAGGTNGSECPNGGGLRVVTAELREHEGAANTERVQSPSPRSSSMWFSKIFRRRSHDSCDDLTSPRMLSGGPPLPMSPTAMEIQHTSQGQQPSSRRSSLSEAPSLMGSGGLLPDEGLSGRVRRGHRGDTARRMSGSEGTGDYNTHQHQYNGSAIMLPQALEVLLFVLRKASSASLVLRSMEGLDACLSPDYSMPHHQQQQSGGGRRARVTSDGAVPSGDDDMMLPESGLAEANMQAVMAQKHWLSWFHGLATTLYVRSVDAGAAFPFVDERGVGMETSVTSMSDTDSFVGSDGDGMDVYGESSAGDDDLPLLPNFLNSFLEPVYSIVLRIIIHDLRLAHRSHSRHFMGLFSLAEGQTFQSAIVSGVLDTLQRSPVLSSEHAAAVLKNLASLLEMAEEHLTLSLELCVKGVHAINLLGYKNGTVVRSKMKDVRLLDMRNILAQHCLVMKEVELRERVAALAQMESVLETLACSKGSTSSSSSAAPCVSESQLVLLLLRYYLEAAMSPEHHHLQAILLRLLASVIRANPIDCRRCLIRAADDLAPQLLASLGCPLSQEEEAQRQTERTAGTGGSTSGGAAQAPGSSSTISSGGANARWSLVGGLGRVSGPVPVPLTAPLSSSTEGAGGAGVYMGSTTSRSTSPADLIFLLDNIHHQTALDSAAPAVSTTPTTPTKELYNDVIAAISGCQLPASKGGAGCSPVGKEGYPVEARPEEEPGPPPMPDGGSEQRDGETVGPGTPGSSTSQETRGNGAEVTSVEGFIAWLGEETAERAQSRRSLKERVQRELDQHGLRSAVYWEKKAGRQAKLQMQCLERNLKHSLLRQKVLMETSERCSAFADKCIEQLGAALSAWNASQRLRLAFGKQVFLEMHHQDQQQPSPQEGPRPAVG